MPIALKVISFLTLESSSFGGWNAALIVHSDSGFRGKAGPLNQRVILLTFVASKPLEPSSAGLSFYEMYFHCFTFEFSFIVETLLATKSLKCFTSLLMQPKMTLLSAQYVSS